MQIVCTLGTRVMVPRRAARLRLGIAVLATGGALASWIIISTAVSGGGFDVLSATTGGFLLVLTYTFVSTLRDLSGC